MDNIKHSDEWEFGPDDELQFQYSGEWHVSVEAAFILNPEISVGAKALYLALKAFCPPPSSITVPPAVNEAQMPLAKTLRERLALSSYKFWELQRELIDHGLLSMQQSNKGRFGMNTYVLTAPRFSVHGKKEENENEEERKKVIQRKKEEDKAKEERKEITKERRKQAEAIWNAYPASRRVAKEKTIGYILRAFEERVSPTFLLNQTNTFAIRRRGEEECYTPLSTTWFYQRRYNDDPSTWGKGKTEPHENGDPAGEINGKPARWKKVGQSWARVTNT